MAARGSGRLEIRKSVGPAGKAEAQTVRTMQLLALIKERSAAASLKAACWSSHRVIWRSWFSSISSGV